MKKQLGKIKRRKKYYRRFRNERRIQKEALVGAAIFRATRTRNEVLAKRIINHLKRRHEAFTRDRPDGQGDATFQPPQIFPVSVKVYWDISENSSDMVKGFPDVTFTGLPALIHWLREATIPQRERQVLSSLHRLVNLYNSLRTWSGECGSAQVKVTEEELEEKIVVPRCTKLHNKI